MKIINHDSKLVPVIDEQVVRKAGLLAVDLPVILVSPETMDEIYPPRERVCVSEEAILFLMEKFSESKEWWDEERWERELAECRRRCDDPIIALGVYARSTKIHEVPAIYLCPERIKESLTAFSPQGLAEVSTFVCLHELTHAFLDARKSPPTWMEILEESIANGAALGIYRGKTGEVEALVNRQPVEYRAGWFFAQEWLLQDLLPSFKLAKMTPKGDWEAMGKKWWKYVEEYYYRNRPYYYLLLKVAPFLPWPLPWWWQLPGWKSGGLFTASLLATFARR